MSSSQTSSHHSSMQPNLPHRKTHSKLIMNLQTLCRPRFPHLEPRNFSMLKLPEKLFLREKLSWMTSLCLMPSCLMIQTLSVNSPPSTFNLSMVQEFYAKVSSKFLDSGGEVYVCEVLVQFDSSVICSVLNLEPLMFLICQPASLPHAQSLSQSSQNPSLFVPKFVVRPPKLTPKSLVNPSPFIVAPQRQIVPLSPSYFTATSFAHSRDVATKMATTYAAKGKKVVFHGTLKLSSLPVPMAKHIRFKYSDVDEDEAE
ncbi:hypothetical protein C1H46_041161 [Malus baccata]|uniref:Uncharacterized protein n=1 Tax=Malus baccata TaxID=106549 RepID=A0A540KH17_MALBA|nr:hypothetical protein C1H46_041161 [Malus baccata]